MALGKTRDSLERQPFLLMLSQTKKSPSEWVGALATSSQCERLKDVVEETFTSSARDIQARRREAKRLEEQASDAKNATVVDVDNMGSRMRAEATLEQISSEAQILFDRKMLSNIQQDSPQGFTTFILP